jgi:chlorobactene glucosyltransferase
MVTPLLLAIPWLGIALFVWLGMRIPSPLPQAVELEDAPSVSVVVPARNESLNITACLRSLGDYDYPDFEVIVVDDRSDDDTYAKARAVAQESRASIHVVSGEELPEGWLGKPWACWQGIQRARGQVLLFTDADTEHGPELLRRAVAGLAEEQADLLTVVGRQVMGSFWERLIQPQIFLMMLARFPDFERTARNDRWRDAIANGQFLLFPRASYEVIGGHEVVRAEVAEDLALAQVIKREGLRLRIRSAEDALSTRMYRSLSGLLEGWTKNVITGGLLSFPPLLRRIVPPVAVLGTIALWMVPPALALGAGAGLVDAASGLALWATTCTALSILTWTRFTQRMGAPAYYGIFFPLGAAVTTYILVRSWLQGGNVRWKGRQYTIVEPAKRQ